MSEEMSPGLRARCATRAGLRDADEAGRARTVRPPAGLAGRMAHRHRAERGTSSFSFSFLPFLFGLSLFRIITRDLRAFSLFPLLSFIQVTRGAGGMIHRPGLFAGLILFLFSFCHRE
jgi:hypothetical protein